MINWNYKDVADFIHAKASEEGFSDPEILFGCFFLVTIVMIQLEDCGETLVKNMQSAHEEAKRLRSSEGKDYEKV